MITYKRQSLITKTAYTLKRQLPRDAQVLVKAKQRVLPETLIAQGKKHAGFRTVNLSEAFDILPEKLVGALQKTVGSRLYKGDVVASAQKSLGLKRVEYVSPMDGILTDYDEQTSVLTMQYLPEVVKVAAGLHGEVKTIVPNEAVSISSTVGKVVGVLGLGQEREGTLKRVAGRELPLEPSSINESHKGKIIFGGSQASIDFFYRALNIGIRGVLIGSMDYDVYQRLQGSRGEFEDIGVSLVITEGFGNLPMDSKLYEYLLGQENKYSFLIGHQRQLIIPCSDDQEECEGSELDVNPPHFAILKKGQRVRILVGSDVGRYGKVLSTQKDRCTVDIEGRMFEVLVRNVEIVE